MTMATAITTTHYDNTTNTISPFLRILTTTLHLVSIFLFGGTIFGWAPLKLILVAEGQYSERCHDCDFIRTKDCSCMEQIKQFNAIFTIAQFALNVVSFPVGYFLDKTPNKAYYFTVAGLLVVIGLHLFAISDSLQADYFKVSYGLMALGGSMTIIGSFPITFLLPKNKQPLVLSAASCLFDASSVVFYFVHRLTLSFAEYNWVTRTNLFHILTVIGIITYGTLIICWILLEQKNWKQVCAFEQQQHQQQEKQEEEEKDAINSIITTNKSKNEHMSEPNTTTNTLTVAERHAKRIRTCRLHDQSAPTQLASIDFYVLVTFLSVHLLRCNLYIETVNEYLASIGDGEQIYADIFSFVLPSGVLFIPIIDACIQKIGVVRTLTVTNVLCIVFGGLLFVPSLELQVMNFIIFTCFRAFLYSTTNTYIAETFGVSTLGRVMGCMFTVGAIFSLLQYPAASLSESTGFRMVNMLMLVVCCTIPTSVVTWYSNITLGTFVNEEETEDTEKVALLLTNKTTLYT